MTQTVIDMRSRPSYLHDFYGATPDTPSFEVVKWLNRRTGSQDELHFTRSKNASSFVKEIRAAGIAQAVVVGRDTPGIKHSNDEIMKMATEHKELVGIGSVDPHAVGIKAATDEIERAIRKLGLKGINIEPGFCNPQVAADDAQLYPVYEACQALGVPVTIMSGPTTPRFELTDPASIGRVAKNFPQLKIVCYHGFWPYVNEMVGIAFRWDNVFVVADMYIFLPGGSLYVEAANGFMQDQLLFGSSYPFRAMGQSVEDYRALGFKESVIDKVMGGNAKQVLGL